MRTSLRSPYPTDHLGNKKAAPLGEGRGAGPLTTPTAGRQGLFFRLRHDPDFARRCFNQIKGFGVCGFPESHAVNFALLGAVIRREDVAGVIREMIAPRDMEAAE